MGGKNDRRRGIGYFGKVLDEDGAFRAQHVDDISIVDDFVPYVDRRAVHVQGPFHPLDPARHGGGEAARRAERYAHFGLRRERRNGSLGNHGAPESARTRPTWAGVQAVSSTTERDPAAHAAWTGEPRLPIFGLLSCHPR